MNVVIPAPEIPPKISKGGSQHQLEAMNAESNAPKLARRWLRLDEPSRSLILFSVAPGDGGRFDAQQSAAGARPSSRFDAAASSLAVFSVAPGDWGCLDAHPPAEGIRLGVDLSVIVFPSESGTDGQSVLLFHFCVESVSLNCILQLRDGHFRRVVRNEQKIEIFVGFQLPFPFVLD